MFVAKTTGSFVDNYMVAKVGDYYWTRQDQNELKVTWFFNDGDSFSDVIQRLRIWLVAITPPHLIENASEIRKIRVDLCGKCWETDSEVLINDRAFSGLTFTNGTIKASDEFVGKYVVRMEHANVNLAFYYTYFEDIIINGNFKANCAKVNNFLKCGFTNTVQFLHWKENGIGLVIGSTLSEQPTNNTNVHEIYADQLVFMQYNYEDIVNTNPSSGTALLNAAPDGHISNIVVSSSGKGIVNLRAGLNMYDSIHVYGLTEPDYGFYLDNTNTNFISTHLNNLYLDGCSLYMLNPRQISLSGATVFRHDNNGSGLVIFDTSEQNAMVSRFISTKNTFNTTLATGKKEIEFRTTGGGTWNKEQNIQSFGNMYYGFVEAFTTAPDTQESWRTTSGTYDIAPKYTIDREGSFEFDLKPYHKLNRGIGSTAIPSEWLITSSYQSQNGDDFGVYKLHVVLLPSGNYMAQVQQIGTNTNGISKGFVSTPTVSVNGIISINVQPSFRCGVFRCDSRNTLAI